MRATGTHTTPVSQFVELQCATTALGPGNLQGLRRPDLNCFNFVFTRLSLVLPCLHDGFYFDVTQLCNFAAMIGSVVGHLTKQRSSDVGAARHVMHASQ